VTSLAQAGIAHGPFAHAIDNWHFAPAVNAELNKALLAKLCDGVV
jgi:predicted secreted hydrolase